MDSIKEYGEGAKITILAPVVRGQKGRHEKLFESLKRSGFFGQLKLQVKVLQSLPHQVFEHSLKIDVHKKTNSRYNVLFCFY